MNPIVHSDAPVPPHEPSLGERLRSLREAKGISMRKLAEMCDLTHASISMIERDMHSPSVSSLKKILAAMDMTLSEFFSNQERPKRANFYKASDLVELADGERISYRQVGYNLTGVAMMILHERYAPKASTGSRPYSHSSEEGGVVIRGRLLMTVGDEQRVLEAGDAYYFDSRLPHKMENPFDEECEVISAVSPPTF